jgi:hypothetical protein
MFFPDDAVRVAALAVHLMTNTALAVATYDIDGGQRLVEVLTSQEGIRGYLAEMREEVLMFPQTRAVH